MGLMRSWLANPFGGSGLTCLVENSASLLPCLRTVSAHALRDCDLRTESYGTQQYEGESGYPPLGVEVI